MKTRQIAYTAIGFLSTVALACAGMPMRPTEGKNPDSSFIIENLENHQGKIRITNNFEDSSLFQPNSNAIQIISQVTAKYIADFFPQKPVPPEIQWMDVPFEQRNDNSIYPYTKVSNPYTPKVSIDLTMMIKEEISSNIVGAWLETKDNKLNIVRTKDGTNLLDQQNGRPRITDLQDSLSINEETLKTNNFITLLSAAENGLFARLSFTAAMIEVNNDPTPRQLDTFQREVVEFWNNGKLLQTQVVQSTLDGRLENVLYQEELHALSIVLSNYSVIIDEKTIRLDEAIYQAGVKYVDALFNNMDANLTPEEELLVELGIWLGAIVNEDELSQLPYQNPEDRFKLIIPKKERIQYLATLQNQRQRFDWLLSEAQIEKGSQSCRAQNLTRRIATIESQISQIRQDLMTSINGNRHRTLTQTEIMQDIHWRRIDNSQFDIAEYLKQLQSQGQISKTEARTLQLIYS